ncbi:hypothetical protein V5799_011212 [Amblyomma americanum]|uniref:Peptidase M13 N-terminal domain-containing protein n=1 Tax=Amblyomma americanum TaxID=6943 RepID=A0AAQ4EII9_AMBAM
MSSADPAKPKKRSKKNAPRKRKKTSRSATPQQDLETPPADQETQSPDCETPASSGFTSPMHNPEISIEEQAHSPEEPETGGDKVKVPDSEGAKGIAKDVARIDTTIVPEKNARSRAEPENKPQEERTQSSGGAVSPGQYGPALVALLSIGGKTVELISPERRRSSSGQHNYRSDDAALVFRRQSVLLIVAASAVCSIILTLVVIKLLHTEEMIDLACVSNACRQVAAYLESVVDPSVSPCDDFYRHVCGRWQRTSPPLRSFMAEVAHNFSETRHAALVRERQEGAVERAASLLYRSCLDFYGRPADLVAAARSLFKELDISPQSWMKETTPEAFFADILRLSFVYRFNSLFKITSRTTRNETHYIIDRPPSFAQRTGADHANVDTLRQYLRSLLVAAAHENVTSSVLEQVAILDSERSRNTSTEASRQGKLAELTCGSLSGPTWVDVLAQLRAVPDVAFVEARQFGAICKDLTLVLVETTSAARPLYLMALLLAHVVRYDHKLSEPEGGLRALCLKETSTVFGSAWLPLLTRLLSVSEESQWEIDGYFGSMHKGAKEQVLAREWMTREDRMVLANKLDTVGMALFPPGTSLGDHWELCFQRNASLVLTATDFVRNKVFLQTRNDDGVSCENTLDADWTRHQDLLQGTSLVVDSASTTLIVPHAFGVPPLFYPGLEEKYINLAVLGIAMAQHILGVASSVAEFNDSADARGYPWSQETMARYKRIQNCYASLSPPFHGQLLGFQFDGAFLAPDAFELSYSEKSRLDPPSVAASPQRARATSALFFKRACLPLCKARDAPGELDEATLHAACLLGVSNVPRFSEVFECQDGDRMGSIRECLGH